METTEHRVGSFFTKNESKENLKFKNGTTKKEKNPLPKSWEESNLSPEDEVKELAGLNTQLSRYIDRVRHLQGKNTKLTTYVSAVEESQLKESEQMHLIYKEKLENLKKEKERISRQIVHFGSTYENIKKENAELKSCHQNADKTLNERGKKQLLLENELKNLSQSKTKVKNQRESTETKLAEAVHDQEKLTMQLKSVSDKTEKLSAECHKSSERLEVNSSVMSQKLVNLQKQNSKIEEIKNILPGHTQDQVSSFQESIELGKDCEQKKTNSISKLHTQLSKEIEKCASQEFQLSESKIKLKNLEVKISNLQEEQKLLKERLKKWDTLQDADSSNSTTEVDCKEREIQKIREKIKNQRGEYQTLLELKAGLDSEIAVFRQLVESEEQRLEVKIDCVKLKKRNGPDLTFVGTEEEQTRRSMIMDERQL